MALVAPDGFCPGKGKWNTVVDRYYNVYMFTGSVASPHFLNSGDTDDSLNPQLALSPGLNVIQFALQGSSGGHLGLNLYFNDEHTSRIFAVVPIDGSTNFLAVATGIGTCGQSSAGREPSLGQLKFDAGEATATLTDFHVVLPSVPVVGGRTELTDDTPDLHGSFTLLVICRPLEVSIERTDARMSICWFAATNRTYQLQYHSVLTGDPWRDVGEPIHGASSRACSNEILDASQPQRFYRVMTLP